MSKKSKKFLFVFILCLILNFTSIVAVASANFNWLAVNYINTQKSAYLGEEIILPDVKPIYPQKVESCFFMVSGPDGNTVDNSGKSFIADKEGIYKVFICLIGFDGKTYSESYEVTVVKSSTPVLTEKPVFPIAFLEGFEYDIPKAKFIDYNTPNPTVVNYETYVVTQDGKETKIEQKFSPTALVNGENITFKYIATSSVTNESNVVIFENFSILKTFTLDTYGNRVYEYEKMFLTEKVESAVTTDSGVSFYVTSEASLQFANKLYSDFSIALQSAKDLANFESLLITISDSITQSETITLEYKANDSNTSMLTLNGGDTFTVKGSLKNYTKGLSLSFNQKNLRLLDSESNLITTITKTLNGEPFSGFTSRFVNLKFELKNVSGRSMLSVNDLNGHGLNTGNLSDMTLPYVFPEKDFIYKNNIGDTVFVPRALAADVVDPCLSAKVSVYSPDGEVVKDPSGVNLFEVDASKDYKFIIESLGTYTVQYTTEDINGNSYNYGYYSIFAVDNVAPKITFNKLLKSTAKVGETIKLPDVECTDNITEKDKIFLFITVNDEIKGQYYLKPGDSFTFKKACKYFVRYTAMDENYNMTTVEQIIICK